MLDTSAESQGAQWACYRRMSAVRKVELVEDANRTARLLALTGLAARFPDANEAELQLRYFHLLWGRHLATKVWGPLPLGDGI